MMYSIITLYEMSERERAERMLEAEEKENE